jgi:hypothetical protein
MSQTLQFSLTYTVNDVASACDFLVDPLISMAELRDDVATLLETSVDEPADDRLAHPVFAETASAQWHTVSGIPVILTLVQATQTSTPQPWVLSWVGVDLAGHIVDADHRSGALAHLGQVTNALYVQGLPDDQRLQLGQLGGILKKADAVTKLMNIFGRQAGWLMLTELITALPKDSMTWRPQDLEAAIKQVTAKVAVENASTILPELLDVLQAVVQAKQTQISDQQFNALIHKMIKASVYQPNEIEVTPAPLPHAVEIAMRAEAMDWAQDFVQSPYAVASVELAKQATMVETFCTKMVLDKHQLPADWSEQAIWDLLGLAYPEQFSLSPSDWTQFPPVLQGFAHYLVHAGLISAVAALAIEGASAELPQADQRFNFGDVFYPESGTARKKDRGPKMLSRKAAKKLRRKH